MQTTLDKDFWNNRYNDQQTGWDIGTISTPIKEYVDQLNHKNISILIPGCGNAHEAEYLLQKGFLNITIIDLASAAVDAVRVRLKEYDSKQLHIICGNFFELNEKFDLVIEQTFFCALDPMFRNDYVDKMYELLNTDGKLAGVLFNKHFEGGPPFGGSDEEYRELFSKKFEINVMKDCYNSIAPREGAEVFIILKKPKSIFDDIEKPE